MRKLLSVMLALMLLFTMAVPAFAATNDTEPTEIRTVEEILSEYHEKSFAAEMAEETGTPSAYSNRNRSSGKSLEEETVEELRTAGYEAYHVTSSNYDALEDSLKTDFEEMGLDTDGSYIITISGEPSGNSRGVDPPSKDFYDGGGTSTFTYTYNGATYTMRYVTVTPTANSGLMVTSTYNLSNINNIPEYIGEFGSTFLTTAIDTVAHVPIATIISLLGSMATDSNYMILDPGSFVILASTAWTRIYIQVLDSTNYWNNAQCSEYAISRARCAGYLYNIREHAPEWTTGYQYSNTVYSRYYNDITQRKFYAVNGFLSGTIRYDITGDIRFYFKSNTNEINFNDSTAPLFTHIEPQTPQE